MGRHLVEPTIRFTLVSEGERTLVDWRCLARWVENQRKTNGYLLSDKMYTKYLITLLLLSCSNSLPAVSVPILSGIDHSIHCFIYGLGTLLYLSRYLSAIEIDFDISREKCNVVSYHVSSHLAVGIFRLGRNMSVLN